MDELIPALDQLIKNELPPEQKKAVHQQVYQALVAKIDGLDPSKNTHLNKIIKLVGKKKYQEAKETIMTKDKKSSLWFPIIIIILLLLFLAFLWFTGKLQLF